MGIPAVSQSPFGQWLDGLDDPAAARVLTAMTRIEQGNFSSVKGVAVGVFESRIDFGPGLLSERTAPRS